jgi:hypothetical protein
MAAGRCGSIGNGATLLDPSEIGLELDLLRKTESGAYVQMLANDIETPIECVPRPRLWVCRFDAPAPMAPPYPAGNGSVLRRP